TYEIYISARRQALDQVRVRQEMLAAQAARGIAYFYRNLLDDLDLLARADAAGGQTLGPLVWDKLRGRATALLKIDPTSRSATESYSEGGAASIDQAVRAAVEIHKTSYKPAISSMLLPGKE